MTVFATDCISERLEELKKCLTEIYPQTEIITENDPLMAGKYCFLNHVDIVFADLDNRRIEGLQMEKFVHHSNPEAKFYLTGEMQDFLDWDIIDDEGRLCVDGVSGVISYPVTTEKIKKALETPTVKFIPDCGKSIEILYERLLKSADLQNKLIKAASNNDLYHFFVTQGCKESPQEIRKYFYDMLSEGRELSDDELQMVAGGTSGQQPFIKTIQKWLQNKK